MRRLAPAVVVLLAAAAPAAAQGTPLALAQDRDSAAPRKLTGTEFVTLGDPFFTLVLKANANLVALADVEAAVQPDANKRLLFVVGEGIASSDPNGPHAGRRTVIGFTGVRDGVNLAGTVMLSPIGFSPTTGPRDLGTIEAWGWDGRRGRFNYYRLDPDAAAPGGFSWRFRGSSDGADLLTQPQREGTCFQCHVTGGPVMKELNLPWSNWHSPKFLAEYLMPTSPPPRWPAATTPRFQKLTGADTLEGTFIIPPLRRFNTARLNAALLRDAATGNRAVTADGRMTVVEGRRLLRPLFEATEVNLVSSEDGSGLHPFDPPGSFVPGLQIRLPANFFLNTDLIAGGGSGGLRGLGLTAARDFHKQPGAFAVLTQLENKGLVQKLTVKLNGQLGDAKFGWLVPGPSLVDNDLADQLLRLGVVTPHFLAAALAVDLEAPVFSTGRAGLQKYVPERYTFVPVPAGVDPVGLARDPAADALTTAVVAAIDADDPPVMSPAAEFRTLLKSADAVAELDTRVKAYVARVRGNLAAPGQRPAELLRLYEALIERRKAMLKHDVLKHLDETGGTLLLPKP